MCVSVVYCVQVCVQIIYGAYKNACVMFVVKRT